jgi:trimethylamine--corrinoid protein Co-methyltransferase
MDPMVRPAFSLLQAEQMAFVHARSLEILSSTGVRVHSRRVMELLSASDGVRMDGEPANGRVRARFQEGLVEWAIQTAPGEIDVFGRRGDPAFRLGADRARFGVGVTNLYYQDPSTDEVVPFTRRHMATTTRLGHDLPHFDVISTVGILRDCPPATADLFAVLEMAANTTKPLVLLVSNEASFAPALDLLEHIRPDLAEAPFAIPYLNPVTPLVINASTGDALVEAVLRGLPVIYSNFGMAGASTPITAAGTMVLLNAELLAGLVVSQLARPGAPVILGSLPSFFDLRTLQDFYDPHSMMLNVACAEMMARYGIPHAGTSGSGMGWGADLAASGQLWMNHILSLLGKVGLVPFVGGSLGSKAFSPLLAVYSDDVIGQALRLVEGFPLRDRELDMDTIRERGPGASFMDSDLTLASFRQAYYESGLTPHLSLEEWEIRGRPRFDSLLREHTLQLLADQAPLDDGEELVRKGEAFIDRLH